MQDEMDSRARRRRRRMLEMQKRRRRQLMLCSIAALTMLCIITGGIFYFSMKERSNTAAQKTEQKAEQESAQKTEQKTEQESAQKTEQKTARESAQKTTQESEQSPAGNTVNKDTLENLISNAESYNTSLYTEDSLNRMKQRIQEAKEAVTHPELSDSELLDAYLNLLSSMQELKNQ